MLPPWRSLNADREPDDAVIAARDWFEEARRQGVVDPPVDTTGWVWLSVAPELENGRHVARLINPVAADRAVAHTEEGLDEPLGCPALIYFEMERTPDGWRYCGSPQPEGFAFRPPRE